jgi:hypothetical protein
VHAGNFLDMTLPFGLFYDLENDPIIYEVTLIDDTSIPSWLIFVKELKRFYGTPFL